jgi:hypothetical protein
MASNTYEDVIIQSRVGDAAALTAKILLINNIQWVLLLVYHP